MTETASDTASILSSKEIYLRLLGHVKPYRMQFGLAIMAMLVLAAAEPAIPALLKPLLDGTFVEKDADYMSWTPIAIVLLFVVPSDDGADSGYADHLL